jgi:hypothetical protein
MAEFARVVKPGGAAVLLTSAANDDTMRAALAAVTFLPGPGRSADAGAAAPADPSSSSSRSSRGGDESDGGSDGGRDGGGDQKAGEGGVGGGDDDDDDDDGPRLSRAWVVECRVGFMLFSHLRARLYLLRRTSDAAPHPAAAQRHCAQSLAALSANAAARAANHAAAAAAASAEADGAAAAAGDGASAAPLLVAALSLVGAAVLPATPATPKERPRLYVHKLPGGRGKLPWDAGGSWNEQWLKARAGLRPYRPALAMGSYLV